MTANEKLAQELHHFADEIGASDLPLPAYNLYVRGCVNSRADVQAWADHLGVAVTMGGTQSNIPVAEKTRKVTDSLNLSISFQGPSEQDPEKAALEARIAELEARLAEGGAK